MPFHAGLEGLLPFMNKVPLANVSKIEQTRFFVASSIPAQGVRGLV